MLVRDFTVEEKRESLERILQSQTFSRSDQLRRFLRYVVEMELAGHAADISETSIAVEALGRSPKFVPGDDSSVRSRAHALRQKLQEFYELEAPDALVRIELRKGSYVPAFTERPPEPAIFQTAIQPQIPLLAEPASGDRAGGAWKPFVAGAGAALLAGLFVWWLLQKPAVHPTLREAWGGMLSPDAPVTVCVATPPTLLLKSFRSGTLPPTPKLFEAPKEIYEWYAGLQMPDGGGQLYMSSTMNSMLAGDAFAAARASRLLTSANASFSLLPEHAVRPLALRGKNVLLIGSPNYSPYAGRILRRTPFSVHYSAESREEVISNGDPDRKDSIVFRPQRDAFGQYNAIFGLLTVLPSQLHSESGEKTVLFSGITSAGPQGAMEYFSSPAAMADLKARMAREGHAAFPSAYQVVIRCGVDRSLALSWTYEAHTAIVNPPVLD